MLYVAYYLYTFYSRTTLKTPQLVFTCPINKSCCMWCNVLYANTVTLLSLLIFYVILFFVFHDLFSLKIFYHNMCGLTFRRYFSLVSLLPYCPLGLISQTISLRIYETYSPQCLVLYQALRVCIVWGTVFGRARHHLLNDHPPLSHKFLSISFCKTVYITFILVCPTKKILCSRFCLSLYIS